MKTGRKEETKAIQIRFPLEIYEELKKRAKKERRSLNAEVIVSLDDYLAAKEGSK